MISGWGRYPRVEAEVLRFRSPAELQARLQHAGPLIGRGLGRSYGDSALAPTLIDTARYNHLRDFDSETGLLVCEAGVSLAEIIEVFTPRGWFLPVTPGTRFVTVGGAVASDVHGKNHHRDGSFCEHVEWVALMLADGSIKRCSMTENTALFRATAGGMGLTGIILEVALRLRRVESPWIVQRSRRLPDLAALMQGLEQTRDATYSVAWIDCLKQGRKLGRGVLTTGEHADAAATPDQPWPQPPRTLRVPLDCPQWLLNTPAMRVFNTLYYRRAPRDKQALVSLFRFFYPLDALRDWNRIYGARGFVQYQCVLPYQQGAQGLQEILETVARTGQGAFLAVLKLMGEAGPGYLGFPMPGWTLAMDFPLRPGTLELLAQLDRIVIREQGRIYLTKDARMSSEVFRAGYPGLDEFLAVKRDADPHNRFASLQSHRLGLT